MYLHLTMDFHLLDNPEITEPAATICDQDFHMDTSNKVNQLKLA